MKNAITAAGLLLGVGLLLSRAALAADKPAPPPPPDTTENEVMAIHPAPPPDTTPRRMRVRVVPETGRRARPANPEPLFGVKALALKDGEALLQLADGQRLVHPGDAIGTDVVQVIGDGTLVLERPEAPGRPGGVGTVVVRFDAQGRSAIEVFHTGDPAPLRAPEVAR